MALAVNGVPVSVVSDLNSSAHDAVVLVTSAEVVPVQALEIFVQDAQKLDQGLLKNPAVLPCPLVAGRRLVLSPTGPVTPYHDVRSVVEAAKAGIQRALASGSRAPILVVQNHPISEDAELALLLGAFEALYVPIQVRELRPEKQTKLQSLGVYGEGLTKDLNSTLRQAVALEASRAAARDIGGGDPERMTPLQVLSYVKQLFQGTVVKVTAIDDVATLEREYPLFAAVNRAANSVPRHRGCIIHLEYEPAEYEETLMLVGKGVTYDTGGCDIKAGGVMAGMSRDKCGAAAVAGFFKACVELQPRIKAVGVMCMVRNSVGEEAYVADELIRSRSGCIVRVGNTDAEGRMAMADALTEMFVRAKSEKKPMLYTIATLTGHAHRAVGEGYSIVMDNHVARAESHSERMQRSGDTIGDMVEISRIRREDLKVHRGQGEGDDVHQALNQPSTACPRGHQGPAGFLLLVSGLNEGSVPYCHVDIAASGGSLPHQPTGAPIVALAKLHKFLN